MGKPFFVWQDKMLKKINPDNVVYLVAERNYTRIFLNDKSSYMVRSTLANTLKKLPPDVFIKIHRAVAASVYYIDSIQRDHLLVGDELIPIPVGRLYYKSLMGKLVIIE
ncbi:MAG: LytTR family DNA-binding domain-containing protein [Bacteroidota bacterium]